MKCPFCHDLENKVIDSRLTKDDGAIRRRRECTKCGYRYTTYEQIERNKLMVVKRDGRREDFAREKLADGIQKACQKRPVAQEQIDDLVDQIVDDLSNSHDREVPCQAIGERVMAGLRSLDPVAYVRYASLYRRFEEATDFVQEVKKLEKPYDTLTARLPGI